MWELNANLAASLWPICTILTAIACLYTVFSASCVARLAAELRRRAAPPVVTPEWPTVSILKPLYGAEPELLEHLASFCRQDYPGAFEVVLGVHSADDPAAAVAATLIERNPDRAVHLVIDPTLHGTNHKISNLINIRAQARHDVLVLADSDMRVTPDYLRRVVGALGQPGVGLVTCLYRGLPVAGLWSRLSAMAIDTHFLPSVLTGMRLGLAKPCFGSTIALAAATLDRIGGFQAFRDQLADDYAMGAAVRGLGLSVAVPPLVVGHACTETSLGDLYAHELRWQRTIKLVDPAGFAGAVVTHPLPLALLAATLGVAAGAQMASSLGLIVAALACRLLVQIQVDRALEPDRSERDWRSALGRLALLPARDLLSFVVYLASFLRGTLTWRGERFDVRGDGTMTEPTVAGPGGAEPGRTEQKQGETRL